MRILIFIISFFITSTVLSQEILRAYPFYTKTGAPLASCGVSDPDACRFIDSAVITDATQRAAINQLVVSLKDSSLWTKMYAIYPFVGGTAASHKWNLKDPRNLDVAFRLSFIGSPTQNSTGVVWQVNSYANTFFVPSASSVANDFSMSLYNRVDTSHSAQYDMGAYNSAADNTYLFALKNSSFAANRLTLYMGVAASNAFTTNADAKGYYIATRTSTTSLAIYKNGTSVATNATSSVDHRPTIPIYIGGANQNGTLQAAMRKNAAFVTLGLGLSSTEARKLYNIVQAYQVALGRSV